MFGFSLAKLAVLIIIVVAVWYGFRFLNQFEANRAQERLDRERRQAGGGKAKRAAEEPPEAMVECPVCGTFVPAKGTTACGRSDCPY